MFVENTLNCNVKNRNIMSSEVRLSMMICVIVKINQAVTGVSGRETASIIFVKYLNNF